MTIRPNLVHMSGKGGICAVEEKYNVFIQENIVVPIAKNEREHKIYKLLREHCNLIFCTEEKNEDFEFVCLDHFFVYAIDEFGNCYGSIGNMTDINNDSIPIGMVTSDGRCAKVASSIREFLSLVTFYPYWLDIIELERSKQKYSISELENKYKNQIILEQQNEIADILNLEKMKHAIDNLKKHLNEEFIVYGKPYKNILE